MPSNESIKDYNVYEQLGQGGFAQVYRAQVKETSKEVAIKMIDKKIMKASRMTQRVEHEVQIHYQLKHPSILELYTFFEDKHYVYLVLELATNGEMQRYLKSRQKSFDEDETRHFLKQVVDGMIYLHSHQILHRDLTLSNLLLTKDMNIKIADFGLATQISTPDEKHFTMCGTPNFISPEIASRNAHGLEADVWSLGCMMYTFLTGKPPFDTDGIRNTLNKVVLAEFEMPKYLSGEAQDLISCLLRKNPMDRIPLTKVLEHPFMSKTRHQKGNQQIPSLLPSSSSSSSSFKPINSFNESIDSGRGTMTATNTSSSHQARSTPQGGIGRNLPTLQSGQEQDFHTVNSAINLINQMNNENSSSFLAQNGHSTNIIGHSASLSNNNQSSSSSSSSSSSYHNKATSHQSSSHQKFDDDSSKNMYYNRFLKQQQFDSQTNAPPSPPIKLTSSHSPTKQQKTQLMSASTTSLATTGINNYQMYNNQNNNNQHNNNNNRSLLYQQLSRSNSNLNIVNTITNNSNGYMSSKLSNNNNNNQYNDVPYQNNSPQCINYNDAVSNTPDTNTLNSRSASPCAFPMHRSDSISSLSNANSQSKSSLRSKSKKSLKKSDTAENIASGEVKTISDTIAAFRTGPTLLRPTRQASKNAVLNIMERNEVVLELIKVKKTQQYIMEVIRIDSENDNIIIYQPNNGKGCLISNRPPAPPNEKGSFLQFDYKNLPQNYWKKYDLASKFVKMVRSRTPKITLHIDEAKCILYDTSPDFEAHFLQGTKFHISKEGHIKITNTDGTSLMLNSNSRSTCLSPDMQGMLEKSHKWHTYCLEEEKIREKRQEIYKDIVQFPLTIGRRNPTPSHYKVNTSMPNQSHKDSTSKSSDSHSRSHHQKHLQSREKSYDSDFDYSKINPNNTTHNTTNNSNTSTNFSTNFKLRDEKFGMNNSSTNLTNQELKSASTSSLNNNSVLSNNNSLTHSYQNTNHPLNSMQQQARLRAMNNNAAYDSQSSSPLPNLSSNMNNNYNNSGNHVYNNYQTEQNSSENLPIHQQYHYNNSNSNNSNPNVNNQISQHNRPNSSSSSSSNSHYSSNPTTNNHLYSQQPQYIPSVVQQQQHIQQQMKANCISNNQRHLSTPSPTMLANSMVPLSLLSNNSGDNVPTSLPQRDNFKYYN
jgi:polo-like kinase 4